MKFVASIVLVFFFSNSALANADSVGKLVEKDSSFIMGRYIYVDGKREIELHIDSLRRNEAWGNKDPFPCTIGSPISVFEEYESRDNYLYFAANEEVFEDSIEEFGDEDSTKQRLYFLGKYRRVEERDEYQKYADSVRGVWGGANSPFPPICTFGAPEEIRVVEILQLLPEGKSNRGTKGGPFQGTSDNGRWEQNADTISLAMNGQKKKYLIEGNRLLDLNMMLNIDSLGNKEIYYRASKYKYYLKVAD